jgi:2-dehydro-3-deoxyphosphogluconate aldolase / (4S)-4-hydroxy-2-oxoglutarate aldolase
VSEREASLRSLSASSVLDRLRAAGVTPVVEIDDAGRAVALAQALLGGGLPVVEITFRTGAAPAALAAIRDRHPQMLLIAGTVTTDRQVADAVNAGAELLVAPGLNERVLEAASDASIPMLPGVCTPTDVERAIAAGCQAVKFFPAEPIGGLRYLRALAVPYSTISWAPTGGISPDLVLEYLAMPSVIACGGSWIAPRGDIAEGSWDTIRARAERAVGVVARSRPRGAPTP